MKKTEAEPTIRHLIHEWAKLQPYRNNPSWHPNFSDFVSWLRQEGYSHYLKFRSVAGPHEDAERWFDEEMKQAWRN